MSTVALSSLVKRYGTLNAVDDVSLDVPEGQLVALLGPSGCGKTTTLRMIGGFVETDAGSIVIGGSDVTRLPPAKRNIGFGFQSYALFPHMSVARNVAFGLEMRRLPRAEIATRVAQALDRVRLGAMADRLPKQLSGGQQQRVSLARALVIEPSVLLLDEPLSNLDAQLRSEMKVEIRQIQRAMGITTIFVTHDQDEALSIADRIVVMRAGRIEQDGTPEAVFGAPRSRFVAEFMGVTNLLPGTVEGQGRFRLADGVAVRTTAPAGPDPAGSVLAIRPERLRIMPSDAAVAAGRRPAGGDRGGDLSRALGRVPVADPVRDHADGAAGNPRHRRPGDARPRDPRPRRPSARGLPPRSRRALRGSAMTVRHDDLIVIDGLIVSDFGPAVFEDMRRGGITAANCTCSVWEDFVTTMRTMARWRRWFREHAEHITPVHGVADIHRAKAESRTGIIHGWQNTSAIEDRLEYLELFHALGLRIV